MRSAEFLLGEEKCVGTPCYLSAFIPSSKSSVFCRLKVVGSTLFVVHVHIHTKTAPYVITDIEYGNPIPTYPLLIIDSDVCSRVSSSTPRRRKEKSWPYVSSSATCSYVCSLRLHIPIHNQHLALLMLGVTNSVITIFPDIEIMWIWIWTQERLNPTYIVLDTTDTEQTTDTQYRIHILSQSQSQSLTINRSEPYITWIVCHSFQSIICSKYLFGIWHLDLLYLQPMYLSPTQSY